MNSTKKGKVLKIISGTFYHILDVSSKNIVIIELNPTPKNKNFYPLLKLLSENEVTYQTAKKSNKIKQQIQKGSVYLNGKSVATLYENEQEIKECLEEKIYEKDQIVQSYIMDVQCLKVKLYLLNQGKYLTYYFSQLKLPKVQHTHPKEVWQKTEQYFRSLLLGNFVQIKINGSESYRQEINVYGQILQLSNGLDLKQKCLEDGYADLSKNCDKYLTPFQITKLTQIIAKSKQQKKGIWFQQKATKGANQLVQQKYSQWQQWIKSKQKFQNIKNIDQELKQICSQFKKNSTNSNKCDFIRGRVLLEVVMVIFEDCVSEKNLALLQEFVKGVIGAFINLQALTAVSASSYAENTDFLRYVNKLIILVLFYVLQNQKMGNKNKTISVQLEKIIKVVFKYCFIGNQTFHKKVFDKRKQSDFQKFQFDPAYLSGISSYSQTSDMEDERSQKYSKTQKKIASAQTKIRVNATLLISNIFKNYPSIVQNHWQICVNSNILTKDFMEYLQKLKISAQPKKMNPQQKQHIASLMRTNFGQYSLLLLIFFQQNAKVKLNALSSINYMLSNFQSRKLIDTTESPYIQKLLNQTKSSFVPKSFIVFSALRNALYFMLFSLHHERNFLIIINTFKGLQVLCQQSTLIDKMGFREGMGLLMANYIRPVMGFDTQNGNANEGPNAQIMELKALCIGFLGALVNTHKKWDEMQNQYLLTLAQNNINYCLIKILLSQKKKQQNKQQHDKLILQITKYFRNMAKKYYAAVFFEITPGVSVWSAISTYYLKNPRQIFPTFVEQIFKCHFDQISLIKGENVGSRKILQATAKAQSLFGVFLAQFYPIYSQIVTVDNYIGLINTLTYIPYHKWSDPSYQIAKQFLIHCFQSVSGPMASKRFPSFESLKQNSLVRLSLIKLLGYLSFCKQFQIPQFSTPAMRNLLQYSRLYKSPNSVIKITWGISNWCNIDCFKQGLTKEQIRQCLEYMVKLSTSQKEKIASNCTRGIGFFVGRVQGLDNVQIQQCKAAIIRNLSHPIVKVRTNSTKTLRLMVSNGLIEKLEQNSPKTQQLISILQQNILKNNYHLQTQTLLLIKDLDNPIKQRHMIKIYSHILHDLLNHTTMQYEFSQIKALKQLRKVVLEEMVNFSKYICESSQTMKDFYQTIQNYLLDSQQQSIRKQAQHSKILERGFQKGEQALKAVFNIKKQKYDEQKMIATQFTMRGIQYEANQQDIELLERIRKVGRDLFQQDQQKEKWKFLSQMRIEGRKIILGKF